MGLGEAALIDWSNRSSVSHYYRQATLENLKALNLEPGCWNQFTNRPPPPWPSDPYTQMIIICDALTQEGVDAWSGDATSIIAQIITAYAHAHESEKSKRECDEKLRQTFPALEAAWDQYQMILKMCESEADNAK